MTTEQPEERDQELTTPVPESGSGASRGRRTAVVGLLVLACVLAPLAAVAIFLKNQVTDTDRYVRTITPLASNPDIQAAVAADLTTALFTRVDVEAEAEAALPERAKFLAVPLARGLENVTREATQIPRLSGSQRLPRSSGNCRSPHGWACACTSRIGSP